MDLIIFPLLMVGMYLLLVRPQQKRLKAQRELIASVAVGDEVVTAGGIIGPVRVLTDDRIFLEVADGVELRVLRGAISRTIEPATTTGRPAASATSRASSAPRLLTSKTRSWALWSLRRWSVEPKVFVRMRSAPASTNDW